MSGILGSGNISEGNCYNIGNINIEDIIVDNNSYVLLTGSIVGNLTNIILNNCYNYGNIQTNAIKRNVYSRFNQSEVSTERCYFYFQELA